MAIILQYALEGLSGLYLCDNKEYTIKHTCISKLYINNDLTYMKIVLNEGVNYLEQKENIEKFVDGIIFNILCYFDVEINKPKCRLVQVQGEDGVYVKERIALIDTVQIIANYDAENVYKIIVNKENNIHKWYVQCKNILKILDNPNRIIVFLALYDLILVLVSGDTKPEQRRLHDYLGKNKDKYPNVSFIKTGDKKREDSLTYLRNRIVHFEQKNDYEGYLGMEKEVTSDIIRTQLRIINDILCES